MKLQQLLCELDLKKVKLLRHNISREDVAKNYHRGSQYFQLYQSLQHPNRFGDCEYILSFLGNEGTNGVYLGCYKIFGCVPYQQVSNLIPDDLSINGGIPADEVFYHLEKTDFLADLENRLVIDWGKSTRGWCQNGTTEKEVLYIRPTTSNLTFTSYDQIILSFDELRTIILNPKDHLEWENRLSAVAGVYLIVDTQTGKQYVGSASGEDGGIWGRWSTYAKTKHGGNKRLIELLEQEPTAYQRFQYSILEVFPIKRDKHDILRYEQLYKKKLCSIQFGLNDN